MALTIIVSSPINYFSFFTKYVFLVEAPLTEAKIKEIILPRLEHIDYYESNEESSQNNNSYGDMDEESESGQLEMDPRAGEGGRMNYA